MRRLTFLAGFLELKSHLCLVLFIPLLDTLEADLLVHHACHLLVLFTHTLQCLCVAKLKRFSLGLDLKLTVFNAFLHDLSFFFVKPCHMVADPEAFFPLLIVAVLLEFFQCIVARGRVRVVELKEGLLEFSNHGLVAEDLLVLLLEHTNCVEDIQRVVDTSPEVFLLLAYPLLAINFELRDALDSVLAGLLKRRRVTL